MPFPRIPSVNSKLSRGGKKRDSRNGILNVTVHTVIAPIGAGQHLNNEANRLLPVELEIMMKTQWLALLVAVGLAGHVTAQEDRKENRIAYTKIAASYRVTLAATRTAKLNEEPVIRWTKPAGEIEAAALFFGCARIVRSSPQLSCGRRTSASTTNARNGTAQSSRSSRTPIPKCSCEDWTLLRVASLLRTRCARGRSDGRFQRAKPRWSRYDSGHDPPLDWN